MAGQFHVAPIWTYRGRDGTDWIANWNDDSSFHHVPQTGGPNPAPPGSVAHDSIWAIYMTADNTSWQSRWDGPSNQFYHQKLDNAADNHYGTTIIYLAPDDSVWAAARTQMQFFHVCLKDPPGGDFWSDVANFFGGILQWAQIAQTVVSFAESVGVVLGA
jgi:hypothetical protein